MCLFIFFKGQARIPLPKRIQYNEKICKEQIKKLPQKLYKSEDENSKQANTTRLEPTLGSSKNKSTVNCMQAYQTRNLLKQTLDLPATCSINPHRMLD